jgi:cysteinyl-tRNA synthetase
MVASAKIKFAEAMDDDLNTSGAAGVVHEFVRDVNRNLDAGKPVPGARAAFEGFMSVFGVPLAAAAGPPAEVQSLARSREEARKRKDWKESDRLRDEIQKLGWSVKDTKDGSKLSKS